MSPAEGYVRAAVAARAQGDFAGAEAHYRSALVVHPHLAVAIKGIADTRRNVDRELLELARKALRYNSDARQLAMLYFALGKCHDDLSQHEQAWQSWEIGNRLEAITQPYSPAADRAAFESLERAFPSPIAGSSDTLGPIFIVGLPRSGSTLLERIVSAHPAVFGMGEQAALPDACVALAAWSEFDDRAAWEEIGATELEQAYYARLRHPPVPAKAFTRWTDKQLLNFCYVPLALRAFPGSRILHISRHPLATALGIYRQRFQGSWHFAYQLEHIGSFMVGYARLMHHWHRLAPGHLMHVSLEELVGAPRETVDRVLGFLGLSFDEACYHPERNPAPIGTMSAVQGRSPINAKGLDHWRAYLPHLEGLAAQLQREGLQLDSPTWSSSPSSSSSSSSPSSSPSSSSSSSS